MDGIAASALRRRGPTTMLLAAALVAGLIGCLKLILDVRPGPAPPVEVVTLSTGQSAAEMDRQITIPIEIQLANLPHVASLRTISLFGLSDVRIQFAGDLTYSEAEQLVINRLSQMGALPNGALPKTSPQSPIGETYRYRVAGPPGYSVTDLETLQNWVLERRLKAVPGVLGVSGWGGEARAYEVSIDRNKLIALGVTLPQVLAVIGDSNVNRSGQAVSFGREAVVVRGAGPDGSIDQLRDRIIASAKAAPVKVGDIATVHVDPLPSRGIEDRYADDGIVQGIVTMRGGENSLPGTAGVEREVRTINTTGVLPPGVSIKTTYGPGGLVAAIATTFLHNLAEGMILIFIATLGGAGLMVIGSLPAARSLAQSRCPMLAALQNVTGALQALEGGWWNRKNV